MSELDLDMQQLREQKNLRTIDVAYKLDIAESTVRNWEKGRTIPKLRLDQHIEAENLDLDTKEAIALNN